MAAVFADAAATVPPPALITADRSFHAVPPGVDELRRPTGRILVTSPDAERAEALLDGRVEVRDGDRLVIRETDPASLNARLVAAGLRVAEVQVERRTLEDAVLEVTRPGSDRVDRSERTDRVDTVDGHDDRG